MKPAENLSSEPGVLAVVYGFSAHNPLVEVVDAARATTAEIQLNCYCGRPWGNGEFDAALTDLGYSRTGTWHFRHGSMFCDVTTTQPDATRWSATPENAPKSH